MYSALRIAPLMVFPLLVFALCVTVSQGNGWIREVPFTIDMFSGARWFVSYGDIFLLGSLMVLFVEICKAVNTDAREILNHGLSMLIAIISLVLFLTAASFTNSVFFLLVTMTFFDVVAGFVITIVAARRDIGTASR